jgi:hypothetical protein
MKTKVNGKTVYFGWNESDIRQELGRRTKPLYDETDKEYKEMIDEHIRLTVQGKPIASNSIQ